MTMTESTIPPLGTDELAAMSPEEFVAQIRARCCQPGHGMMDHPVVAGIEAGTVTLPQLRLFTEQFYLHIRNMLPWIGEMYVNCPFEDVRLTLVKNLAEECLGTFSGTKGHPDLLLDFAAAIGADVEAMRAGEQLPVGRRLTEYFEFMARCRPWFVPLAAIGIGLESFVPVTFRRLVDAFQHSYGLSDEAVRFWSMHILADSEHGDEGIEIVSRHVVDPAARRYVFDGTVETARLYYDLWNVFTAVDAG